MGWPSADDRTTHPSGTEQFSARGGRRFVSRERALYAQLFERHVLRRSERGEGREKSKFDLALSEGRRQQRRRWDADLSRSAIAQRSTHNRPHLL